MELNKIYNEDCLVGMKRIPDKSVDMILCDLPYGTTRNKWDTVIPLELLWEQYERVVKDNGAVVLTAQTPFDKVLGTSNLKILRYEWVWNKVSPTGHLNAKKMPMKKTENILVFYKKLPTYNAQGLIYNPRIKTRLSKSVGSSNYGKHSDFNFSEYSGYPTNLLKFKRESGLHPTQKPVALFEYLIKTYTNEGETVLDNCMGSSNYGKHSDSNFSEYSGYPTNLLKFKRESGLHPTQKPVGLFEYLIKTYTNEGETVLDNCMGSGTTAIACINTNRNYIGFEMDEGYYNASLDRIEEHKKTIDAL